MISEQIVSVRGVKLLIRQTRELRWEGYIENKPVCEFEYLFHRGKVWANNISTIGKYQQRGFGEQMIIAAMKVYGAIYFATAEKSEYSIPKNIVTNDSRYHNDENLLLFANRLAAKGTISPEWIAHPFK